MSTNPENARDAAVDTFVRDYIRVLDRKGVGEFALWPLEAYASLEHEHADTTLVDVFVPRRSRVATIAGAELMIKLHSQISESDPATSPVVDVQPSYRGFEARVNPLGYAMLQELIPNIDVLPPARAE